MYDLNVPWPNNDYGKVSESQLINLRNIVATLYSFKVFKIAINFEIDESVRVPINDPHSINPIQIDQIIDLDTYPGLNIYTRLTVVVNDSSKLVNFNKFQNYFDIIAIKPVSEKALQLSIINLNIDLISINLASKLNFYIKHKIVGQALKKGIKFEVCYDGIISNSSSMNRKFLISNIVQLIRATRSQGLIISSGCVSPINLRSLNNIVTFLATLGLKRNNINQFIENSKYVLMNGRLRVNSYKQIVAVDDDPDLIDNSKDDSKNNSIVTGYKKRVVMGTKKRGGMEAENDQGSRKRVKKEGNDQE